VSWQLLQDSAIDIEGFLVRALGTRLARITNTHLTVGTGVAQPQGIVPGITLTASANSATAIEFDDLVDLQHAIDPAYRTDSARFMFQDDILLELRKIRDDSGGAGVGRPIWEPSVQVGEPSRILGHSYVINQDMIGTMASTNRTVLYGDFATAYIHRQVKGIQVVRLDERYADFLQTGWFGYLRQDGDFDEKLAVAALVH
jgi:HK97 family phage major capsid protein